MPSFSDQAAATWPRVVPAEGVVVVAADAAGQGQALDHLGLELPIDAVDAGLAAAGRWGWGSNSEGAAVRILERLRSRRRSVARPGVG